jgi:hypothetical protein
MYPTSRITYVRRARVRHVGLCGVHAARQYYISIESSIGVQAIARRTNVSVGSLPHAAGDCITHFRLPSRLHALLEGIEPGFFFCGRRAI